MAMPPHSQHLFYGDEISDVHPGVYAGDYCFDLSSGEGRWCAYGCCGYLDRECCSANVVLIVGLTVLAILVVSGGIAMVCCCMRRRAAAGQVISTHPVGGGNFLVTGGTTVSTMGQPVPYNTQAYQPGTFVPPPYATHPQPPPQYSAATMAPPPYSQMAGQDNQAYKSPN